MSNIWQGCWLISGLWLTHWLDGKGSLDLSMITVDGMEMGCQGITKCFSLFWRFEVPSAHLCMDI